MIFVLSTRTLLLGCCPLPRHLASNTPRLAAQVGDRRPRTSVCAQKEKAAGHKRTPLTPYQGPNRRFGLFKCPSCRRKWLSGNSWANCGQDCKRCEITVYPYEQLPLERREEEDEDLIDKAKPHPFELCEKCRKLGSPCTGYDRR